MRATRAASVKSPQRHVDATPQRDTSVSTITRRGTNVSMRIGRRGFASRKKKVAGLFAFLLAAVIGLGAYAFTASNEVKPRYAGAGTATVSGYKTVKNISYGFNEQGTDMTSVTFVLEGTEKPSDVKVALTPGTPKKAEWVDCEGSGGKIVEKAATEFEVSCFFNVEDKEGDNLAVAAVSEGEVKIEA